MPINIRKTDAEELSTLQEYASSPDTRISKRARLLLSSLDGETTNDIARLFGVSERTVRNTIHAFNAHGLDSIHPMDLSGRPTIFTDTQREALLEMLSRSLSEFGIDSRVWKLSDIAAAMETLNIAQGISIRTLRRENRRCGIELADIKSAGTVRIPAGAARSGKVCNTQGSTSLDGMPSTEAHSIYADRMLRLGERSLYDEVVKNLRDDYAAITGAHSLHLELAAVYYVKLVRAQADGDWEQAERFDRMMHNHLKELKAAKKKQESQRGRKTGDTPAERAADLVEALRAEAIDKMAIESERETEEDMDGSEGF